MADLQSTKYLLLGESIEDELIFENYHLTELMLTKKKKTVNKLAHNYALYMLLSQKLEQYGIATFMSFERQGLTFRAIKLLDNFPLENEPIIAQLYGYKNYLLPIQVEAFENFSVQFDYDTTTKECTLERWSFQVCTHKVHYKTLAALLKDIKQRPYFEIFQ